MLRMPKRIPEILPTSPLTIVCPFCKAKRGQDCETSKGGFAVVHVKRIQAAAARDADKDHKKNDKR